MAGGPGGTVIDKVSIRVVPDTSKFKELLKAQLEAMVVDDFKVEVTPDFDSAELKRQVQKAAKEAVASVTIGTEYDPENLKSKVKSAAQAAREDVTVGTRYLPGKSKVGDTTSTNTVQTKLSGSDVVRMEVERIRNLVRGIDAEVDVKVNPDTSGPNRQLRAVIAKLNKGVEVHVSKIDMSKLRAIAKAQKERVPVKLQIDGIESEIQRITRATPRIRANIEPEIDRAKLFSQVYDLKATPIPHTVAMKAKVSWDINTAAAGAKIEALERGIKKRKVQLAVDVKAAKGLAGDGFKVITTPARKTGEFIKRSSREWDRAFKKKYMLNLMMGETYKTAAKQVRDLQAELKEVSQRRLLNLDVTTSDFDSLMAKIKQSQRMLREMEARDPRISAEIGDALAKLRALKGYVEDSLKHGSIKIDTEDLAHAWLEIQRVGEALDRISKDRDVSINANPNTKWASLRMAWLTRPRLVDIEAKINESSFAPLLRLLAAGSGARFLNKTLGDLWDRFKDLDKNILKFSTMSLTIAGVSIAVIALTSNVFALGGSLAQIGYLALLLPGMMGAFAIGIGSMIASFKDFNKVLPEVGKKFTALQNQMSGAFWERAKQPIRDFINNLWPQFSRGMTDTSAALGGLFAHLATSLKGTLGPVLGQMFKDLNQSITISRGAMGGLAQIITVFGQVGTTYLPALAEWFVEITNRFGNFLTRAQADGSLKGWIDSGISALQGLGNVLKNLGSIFASIARAASSAGGANLNVFGAALERIATAMKDPAFQTGLANVFHAAHKAMGIFMNAAGPGIASLFKSFGEISTTLLPLVGGIIGQLVGSLTSALAQPAFMDGLVKAFEGIGVLVANLAPVMAPLGAALGAILGLVGSMAASFAPLLAQILGIVAAVVTQLAPALEPVIEQLTSMLGPIIEDVGRVILESLLPAIIQLLPQFTELLAAIEPIVNFLITSLFPVLGLAVGVLTGTLGAAITYIIGVINSWVGTIEGLGQVLIGLVTGDMTMVETGIRTIWDSIKGYWEGVFKAIGQFLEGFMQAFLKIPDDMGRMFPSMKGQADKAKTMMETTWNNVKKIFTETIPKAITEFLSGFGLNMSIFGSKASTGGTQGGQGFLKGVRQKFEEAIDFLRSIPGKAASALGNLGGTLVRSGEALVQGFIRGIGNMVESARSAASNVVNAVKGFFPNSPAKEGAFSGRGWTLYSGHAVMNDWALGLSQRKNHVVDTVSGIMSGVKDVLDEDVLADSSFAELQGPKMVQDLNSAIEGQATFQMEQKVYVQNPFNLDQYERATQRVINNDWNERNSRR